MCKGIVHDVRNEMCKQLVAGWELMYEYIMLGYIERGGKSVVVLYL